MAVLPQGFIDLFEARQAKDETRVDIIGVVMDIMAPVPTRGTQHMLTFKLSDRRLFNSGYGSEGLKVRFFMATLETMPKVRDIGDVVLLRSVKMTTLNGERIALSNYHTGVLVFPWAAIPNPSFQIAYQDKQRLECLGVPNQVQRLNLAEQAYVVQVKADMSVPTEDSRHRHSATIINKRVGHEDLGAGPPTKKQKLGNSIGGKFKLIKEVTDKSWADIVGLVIKRIQAQYGCDLYITDYTPNNLLRHYPAPEEQTDMGRDGDAFGYSGGSKKPWPGPFGQLVLKVNIKPPHADFALNHVQEGDLVLLRNVKSRITTWGDHGLFLEGDMWPDYQSPDQVNVRNNVDRDSAEVKALMERKALYWKAREQKVGEQKEGGKLTKAQKTAAKKEKKEEKKRKKAEQAGESGEAAEQAAEKARQSAEKIAEKLSQSVAESTKAGPNKLNKNPHVRCSYEEVPVSSIKAILDRDDEQHNYSPPKGHSYTLPFFNARYRAKVRVVDYEPKSLEEFAVPILPDDDDKSVDSMAWQYDGTPNHEWSFSLLLEDASQRTSNPDADRIWVQVHHEQAQFLFGNGVDDPEDLGHNSRLLSKLREKMFVLWGNLEEKTQDQELSNLPFECCIMEYGIERDDDDESRNPLERWQRMYAMFGATIL